MTTTETTHGYNDTTSTNGQNNEFKNSLTFDETAIDEEKMHTVDVEARPAASRLQSYESTINSENRQQERWNYPRSNIFRLSAAYLGFLVLGFKDSAIGILLPHLEEYYNVDHFTVSLAFLSPVAGYLIACTITDNLHRLVGRWGITMIAAGVQLVFYITASCKPPFPLFVVLYMCCGFGSALLEGSCNTMCGTLQGSNQLLGCLHGFYGIGGVILPTVGQTMLAKGILWNNIYFIMVGVCGISFFWSAWCFRNDRAADYKRYIATDDGAKKAQFAILDAIRQRLIPFLAVTVFLYVGGEVCMGGWTTTYMIDVRHGNSDTMGYVSTGYWIGIALGRIVLGFVSARVGNLQLMVVVYLSGAIILSIILWTVPVLMASAVAASLIGLFIGPLYPTMMAVAVTKLPKRLHVSGLGFASTFGGGGAAVLPFIAGILAENFGTWSIAPLIFSAFSGMMCLWLIIWKLCQFLLILFIYLLISL